MYQHQPVHNQLNHNTIMLEIIIINMQNQEIVGGRLENQILNG